MMDRSRNAEDVLPPGTRIEEFVIERELQSGGFGVTYLAQDRSLGRWVAIDGGADTNFRLTWPVSPGTYYVRVRHFGDGGTGDYAVIARLATP